MATEIILSATTIEGEINEINFSNQTQRHAWMTAVENNQKERRELHAVLDAKVDSGEMTEQEYEEQMAAHLNKVRLEIIEKSSDLVDMGNPHLRGKATVKLIF